MNFLAWVMAFNLFRELLDRGVVDATNVMDLRIFRRIEYFVSQSTMMGNQCEI